jgi:two-component system OmpR family response regulator
MKVLVIEDDRETAAFIARGLRETGATVDCAETAWTGSFSGARAATT